MIKESRLSKFTEKQLLCYSSYKDISKRDAVADWFNIMAVNKIRQVDLADAVGLSRMGVNRWVGFHREPSARSFALIEDYLKDYK